MIDHHPGNEILRAHAGKTEQDGRPAAESLGALRENGVFALRTPADHGGAWANAETIARRLTALGRACPSTAWVAGTCVTAKNLAAGCLPGPGAQECFADPDSLFCGSGVPAARGERVPGGVRVTGRWPNVSGCEDAAWATLALMVEGAFSLAVVPVTDLTVERTWHMAGMRGTGSHTLVADDVLVPAHRVAAAAGFPFEDRLLYSMTVLGPVVGAARGALDVTEAMFASDRKPFMSAYSRMGESPGARHWLAEATHLVNRAEHTMLTVAGEADSAELSQADAPRLFMDLADAGRDCRAAVERMLDLHGASGFSTTNALQRYWRDVAVGSRHPHLNPYLAVEAFGTALVDEGR
ncbi:alkylation response protein AidB-like acyl-CoA dehydrogenase [Amycolatopsis bartoniae]|uniref:Acyl-CoA dehydrogenase n=1 Tax=Amycolatopsis bartoniae TaxID=941986 RepID=A0A8H9IV92_9PSEU|nr:acyl-CoA dehydrogenase family protein [Amycolatopsis bartoniae]MBB2938610.1 alkylation response protein AidB-like acyl-CoA dehydrogenase [Amycolatopsis bartoniae]TVT08890.1 acyl-CoA dehydrogenase [Amycolatopsis bartoniae]GHF69760.1 acyl-CoA dehydrogenase [Amycolatopsis bartoniae]